MKKGLRHSHHVFIRLTSGPALRPDEEGIKTLRFLPLRASWRPALRPDEEGIKTSPWRLMATAMPSGLET